MTARARTTGTLVSVDGVRTRAVARAAKQLASAARGDCAGVSGWDASGLFGDLDAPGPGLERPSARTLLLLYAADLAFRLRWQIRPALAEGRRIIAAPYIDTAMALGRAAGISDAWLRGVFTFAPAPTERHYVKGIPLDMAAGPGFIEFACRHLVGLETRADGRDFVTRTHARLSLQARRRRPRS